ncbi:antibiotic biosynthesis monooxygenase family protein [Marinospirillum sp.]|uniref:antibiotic biosynthesis monooxygenase family protein n=1 Tax=Marinospirillum sp. TaxID=2183934 RepID=UPI00384D5463
MMPLPLVKYITLALVLFFLAGCAGPGHRQLPQQLEAENDRQPVVSIQGYQLCKSTSQQQLRAGWERMAEIMSSQPGFIKAELNQGSGESRLWIEMSYWKDAASLRSALENEDAQKQLQRMPKARFNHLFVPEMEVNSL